jgi:hypothetical protein
MKRNGVALLALVAAQLGIAYGLYSIPGKIVDWSSDVRLVVACIVVLAIGAVAYILFHGKPATRVCWAALSAALPPLVAEAVSWSDTAYPGLNYLVAIVLAAVASLGALGALVVSHKGRNK